MNESLLYFARHNAWQQQLVRAMERTARWQEVARRPVPELGITLRVYAPRSTTERPGAQRSRRWVGRRPGRSPALLRPRGPLAVALLASGAGRSGRGRARSLASASRIPSGRPRSVAAAIRSTTCAA